MPTNQIIRLETIIDLSRQQANLFLLAHLRYMFMGRL